MGAHHPVEMANSPAGAVVGTVTVFDATQNPTISALGTPYANTRYWESEVTVSGGALTVGRALIQHQSSTGYIAMNARI
jgi:hypothetical protein